jgi:hypothetical protein
MSAQKVYHKLATIKFQDGEMKLKVRSDSTADAIETSIRNRFGISDSERLILVDFEGCDVVIDATLTTGKYTLELAPKKPTRHPALALSPGVSAWEAKAAAPAAAASDSGDRKVEVPADAPKKAAAPAAAESADTAGIEIRKDITGKIEFVSIDCDKIGLTEEIEEAMSYTIMEDDKNKIDVQFVYGNNAFAKTVEFRLKNWKSSKLEVLQWIPFDPDKESELLNIKPGVISQFTGPTGRKLVFPFIVTALFNEGEGSLLIKDRW